MFTHHLCRYAFTYDQVQPDGRTQRVLQVFTALPMAPASFAQARLADAIVQHMIRHPEIDRADIN